MTPAYKCHHNSSLLTAIIKIVGVFLASYLCECQGMKPAGYETAENPIMKRNLQEYVFKCLWKQFNPRFKCPFYKQML